MLPTHKSPFMWFLCFISRSKPERDTHKESILLLLLLLLLPHLSRSTLYARTFTAMDRWSHSPCTSYCAARSEMQLEDALESSPAVVSNVSRIQTSRKPALNFIEVYKKKNKSPFCNINALRRNVCRNVGTHFSADFLVGVWRCRCIARAVSVRFLDNVCKVNA